MTSFPALMLSFEDSDFKACSNHFSKLQNYKLYLTNLKTIKDEKDEKAKIFLFFQITNQQNTKEFSKEITLYIFQDSFWSILGDFSTVPSRHFFAKDCNKRLENLSLIIAKKFFNEIKLQHQDLINTVATSIKNTLSLILSCYYSSFFKDESEEDDIVEKLIFQIRTNLFPHINESQAFSVENTLKGLSDFLDKDIYRVMREDLKYHLYNSQNNRYWAAVNY